MYSIYCATCFINNKSYIGLTKQFLIRKKQHIKISKSNNNKKKIFAFHHALKKYGPENFTWIIIETHDNLSDANDAEEFFISYFETLAPNGYNLELGGCNNSPTAETRKKISDTLKVTSFFIGKKGVLHPNFGRTVSKKEKENLRKKFSDDGHTAKLTKLQVISIYQEYLDNDSVTASSLAVKYSMAKNTICNILNKKCWKATTKHFPGVNLKDRTFGEAWVLAKLNEKTVRSIKQDIKTMKENNETFISRKLSEKYNTSQGNINNILYNKNWKHVIVD